MEQKPRKVFYVWNYVEWGGAQVYFFGLIKNIRDKTDIGIILPRESDRQLLTFIENLGVEYEFIDTRADARPAKTLSRKIQRHLNKFKSEKIMVDHLQKLDLRDSIIHIELGPWQSLFSLVRLCRRHKVFITMHNSLPPVPNWRYFLWKVKFALITRFGNFHIFASNQDARDSLRPLVPQSFFEGVRVTYTNVDPQEIDEALATDLNRQRMLERFQIPADKFLVFCVGQFIDRKGRWTFLEAARSVLREDPDFVFVWICNSRPTAADLEKAAEYGLGENFILLTSDQIGPEHIDLFKFMRLADIFALVSFQEGLPISLLEAMALGIPSISTNVNAIPEAVKHLETGWLIEAGDSAALAAAFLRLKSDAILRERLSKHGREFVLKHFDERVVAGIALDGYIKAFGGQ